MWSWGLCRDRLVRGIGRKRFSGIRIDGLGGLGEVRIGVCLDGREERFVGVGVGGMIRWNDANHSQIS